MSHTDVYRSFSKAQMPMGKSPETYCMCVPISIGQMLVYHIAWIGSTWSPYHVLKMPPSQVISSHDNCLIEVRSEGSHLTTSPLLTESCRVYQAVWYGRRRQLSTPPPSTWLTAGVTVEWRVPASCLSRWAQSFVSWLQKTNVAHQVQKPCRLHLCFLEHCFTVQEMECRREFTQATFCFGQDSYFQ